MRRRISRSVHPVILNAVKDLSGYSGSGEILRIAQDDISPGYANIPYLFVFVLIISCAIRRERARSLDPLYNEEIAPGGAAKASSGAISSEL
jgi:hypothetical protein